VITPRRTRLVRVPDLHAFRRAIANLSFAGGPERLPARIVLVPTRGAARQLRRTMAREPAPSLATRDELYDLLHARLEGPPARLSAYDRDVIMQAAAAQAATKLLRPGLVAEMLRFYDQLRRQARSVARFEELLDEMLGRDAEHDRGAERMLGQTRLLTAAFKGYEARVRASGACDEHGLRERAIAGPFADPIREIIVTQADWIADPAGLFLADFDLLTRLPGLEAIDIVATGGVLESGFHQRIHDWLPGIEEVDGGDFGERVATARPTIFVPERTADSDRLVFVYRDREEELSAIARRLKAEGAGPSALDRTAVVFKHPLPYLYLAREVFGAARIPYHAAAAMPLAAEPFAGALDAVLELVESGFTRPTIVALLRSPHFAFRHAGRPIDRDDISALDRGLSDSRYLGGIERLTDIEGGGATPIARAAAAALAPLLTAAPASAQLRCLTDFLDAHEVPLDAESSPASAAEGQRLRRSRAAVRASLAALAAAHAAYDDRPITIAEMAASIRRWIEEHTFEPEQDGTGVQFVDDQAARYGVFDDVNVVGLIDGEWPDRPRRNIFYPSSLLASLGWPTETDRRGAAEARFLDLLGSSAGRVRVSTVSLDDDALVEPSLFVDDIPRARLAITAVEEVSGADEECVDAMSEEWSRLRASRSSSDDPAFHGFVGKRGRESFSLNAVEKDSRPLFPSISALETYVGCPFRFFAQYVLKLEEEPDDDEVMDPRAQGQFLHEVFEAFFERWQQDGHEAITPETIDAARALFRDVVEDSLTRLPESEGALERTRLLGSPAAAGLGEAVFRMEAERPVPVVERLLEHSLKGDFTFRTADGGTRTLPIRGRVDRIDLLGDGTFRLIDYKLGWPPDRTRALQLPIYGLSAEQSLAGYRSRHWSLGEAVYIAFKGPKRVVPLFKDADRAKVLEDAQARLLAAVDAIADGRFPPTPDDVFRCETCAYSAVCRKEYVGDV
jgi:RecB family exonuclease